MPATYDSTKASAFPTLRETCADYHVKNPAKNTGDWTRFNVGGKVGEKTQRKQVTLDRHRERILKGNLETSLLNVIGRDSSGNTIVILFSKQGKKPSFYGVHPQSSDGKCSWFPMNPDSEDIPKEYREGWEFRLGGNWGDEAQYDSDGES